MVIVSMVLAQGPGKPSGDIADGIRMDVILTMQGLLDANAWERGRTPWLTTRYSAGEPTQTGELVKISDGWAMRALESEDEPLCSLRAALIRPGEIVRVGRLDGDEMLYRIVAVDADQA